MVGMRVNLAETEVNRETKGTLRSTTRYHPTGQVEEGYR
jgi:hypothetical protein